MSKLIPFLIAGVGASSVSVGGVFMLRNGGGKAIDKNLNLNTLDTFKSGKGGGCVKSLFGGNGIDISGSVSDISAAKTQQDYFGTNSTNETKGCLIIHWKKTTYTDSKGNGTFTGTGSFVNGTKGFAFFGTAETKSPKKLEIKAGAYLFSKSGNKGSLSHKKEVTSSTSKEITNSNFTTKFPKAKLAVIKKETGNYWGFITDESKPLDKICENGQCNDPNPQSETQHKRGEWKWSATGTNGKIGDWCDGLGWWNHIFDANTFSISNKLNSFKGTGTETNPS